MKKLMKRIGAVLMAVAMTAALGVTGAFAVDKQTGVPHSSDKGTITITNLDASASVKAYKIVKANYDDNKGFVGYETVVKLKDSTTGEYTVESIADIEAPKVEELNALRAYIGKAATYSDDNGKGGLVAIDPTSTDNGTATFANMDVGEYMIIVTSSDTDYIYNPMVASVYYYQSNDAVMNGTVDVKSEWEIKGDTVYAKSNKEDIVKNIVNNSRNNPAGTRGDDHAIGDDVQFMIETTIPSYSTDYKFPFFYISDAVSKGLDINTDTIKVYISDTRTDLVDANGMVKDADSIATYEKAQDATITVNSEQKRIYTLTPTARDGSAPTTYNAFKIAFTKDYLQETAKRNKEGTDPVEQEDYYVNGGKTVVVTYTAHINDNATVNLDANTNTAKIEYQNNPDSADDNEPADKESKTYHYTFEIDGNINGSSTEGGVKTWKTHELIKLNEDGDTVSNETVFEEKLPETTVVNALAGAVFKLTRNDEKGNNVYYAMSDANGYFQSYDVAINSVTDTAQKNAINNSLGTPAATDIKGFRGLDAGTYELEEVIAPSGYSRDATKHPVVITATYNTDGTLATYQIMIDNTAKSTYTATYTGTEKKITKIELGDITKTEPDAEHGTNAATTTFIKNVKLSALPSTGGIGTYVFTIAGVAIMAIAAGLLIVRHKKKAE